MKTLPSLQVLWLVILMAIPGILHSQQTQFTYAYPLNNTEKHLPRQNIILKHMNGIMASSVSSHHFRLLGSDSGLHAFTIVSNNNTLIIKPSQPFKQGERVHFSYAGGLLTASGDNISPLEIVFDIINHDPDDIWKELEQIEKEKPKQELPPAGTKPLPEMDNNLPDDYPPAMVVNYVEHDNEYFFLNMNTRLTNIGWNEYISIVDSYGTPVYYNKSDFNRINFHILPNGLLCYAINTAPNTLREKYFLMDSTFTVIDSINTGNGYILDAHDMLLLNNGHYLVMSYDPQPVDMSQVVPGGDPDAIVTGLVIQEVDNQENVYFQWRSWDHFEITDATYDINLFSHSIDYVHANALEIDMDGNILVSCRHLDEITKINFNSGEIMWRFGLNSENNMFQIYNDPTGFSHQHDIRLLPNGNYTLYDNGNLNTPSVSRALEYILDESELVAELQWSYTHPTQLYSQFSGGFRVQNNGQRIIGWGGTYPISSTVVDYDGNIEQQIFLPDYIASYRVFKDSWKTNSFETEPLFSLGNAAGHMEKINRLYIYNTGTKGINITSVHHHDTAFEVLTALPLSIFPGAYNYIEIEFNPSISESYIDRFTLNFDNIGNTERIARQLQVTGYMDEETPSVFIYPAYDSENVSPDTVISILFDEAVTKIFGGDIQDEDIPSLVDLKEEYLRGDEVTFTGEYIEENKQINIYPDQILKENQDYYVRLLANKLKDYDGNIISLAEESYFKTGVMTKVSDADHVSFNVYPNPFKDDVIVAADPGQFKTISIYNIHGKFIKQVDACDSRTYVNLSELRAGVYFIQLLDLEGNAVCTAKILKQ